MYIYNHTNLIYRIALIMRVVICFCKMAWVWAKCKICHPVTPVDGTDLIVCVSVYPSGRIHVAACGPIGTKFGTRMEIHLEMVMGEIKITPCDLGGIWGVLGVRK